MKIPAPPPAVSPNYEYGKVLSKLISIGKFDEFFSINNNRYPYWEKWKFIAKEWKMDPNMLWGAVKSNRRGNSIYFQANYKFTINTPSFMQEHLHLFDLNLGGFIQGTGIVPADERDRYLLSSLMEEAIASSQLEGAVTTRKLAKEMLESNRKPRNESEQMILNNYEAMKWIVANKELSFTEQNILELHRIITHQTLENTDDEGVFRTDDRVNVVDVETGEIVHYPPSHTELSVLMAAFCRFANDKLEEKFFIHPIAKGIILHFLIGYIHPFADGNGRTARTIFYWYLLKKQYWLIEYMSVSRIILQAKAKYARAYLHTELDDSDLTYFILYNLKCIKAALDDLKSYISRKTNEKRHTLELLRGTSFNERQIKLLQEMIHDVNANFSVNKVEKWFDVSNQTARNDLNQLVDAGLMQFRKAGKSLLFFPVKGFTDKIVKFTNGS